MIDKADFRIPARVPVSRSTAKIIQMAERDPAKAMKAGILKKTANYRAAYDLSSTGVPALLHMSCTHGKPNHKLEILGSGEQSLMGMRGVISEVIDFTELDALGIMRADLTADVVDVEVPWFRRHTYVTHKRIRRQIGHIPSVPWMAVQDAVCETFYAGKAPNQLRVYDKVGEQRHRYLSEARREWNKVRKAVRGSDVSQVLQALSIGEDAALRADECYAEMWQEKIELPLLQRMPWFPTFEKRFGRPVDAVVTRVERRCQGRDLENLDLLRFEKLKTLHLVEPFRRIQFFKGDAGEPSPKLFKPETWLAGMHVRTIAAAQGIEAARTFLRRHYGNGNYRRAWSKFEPFLGSFDSDVRPLDSGRLQLAYELSCIKQLAA